ncbi:hypothetical protein BG004_000465 [Podila humilis]|nr:hypothetical protein BG004_000465 [Podila humilis]
MIVQELISEIAVCCSFPCWACFVIGVWYATPKLSVPGDSFKIRVPRPKVINVIFFYLLFGPFLLDLPSVISSGTFLSRKQYTKTNIAIAVHFTTLGAVLMVATGIFFFTLNQLAKAIEEYTVPADMTLIHVVNASPDSEISTENPLYTLSPLPDHERIEQEWDSSLAKVRSRLISIRNAGTVMLCFYVVMYLIYGITRPLIHGHIVWNVFFCICFNLDPGTPTIFAYFTFSILYHMRQGPPRLHQVYSSGLAPVSRPAMSHLPSTGPVRRLSDFRSAGADPHPSTTAYASRQDLSVLQSLEMALLDGPGPSVSPGHGFLSKVESESMFSKPSASPSAEISIPSPTYSASSTLRSSPVL